MTEREKGQQPTPPELTGDSKVQVSLAEWVRGLIVVTIKEAHAGHVEACGIKRLWDRVERLTWMVLMLAVVVLGAAGAIKLL